MSITPAEVGTQLTLLLEECGDVPVVDLAVRKFLAGDCTWTEALLAIAIGMCRAMERSKKFHAMESLFLKAAYGRAKEAFLTPSAN